MAKVSPDKYSLCVGYIIPIQCPCTHTNMVYPALHTQNLLESFDSN